MPSIYSRESRPGLSYSRTSDQRSEYECRCGRWWYSFFEGFNPPDQQCHDCKQMVNSVESETKNRYELMTRILPDDEEASNVTTRVVPIEESRRIDRIMTGSDADILGAQIHGHQVVIILKPLHSAQK